MKTKKILISLLIPVSLFLFGCPNNTGSFDNSGTGYKPVLMKREILENSITLVEKTDIIVPGKIYVKGNCLYIVDKYTGVHVIDNTDPANPDKKGFITIPGCIDISMKSDILYADNAVDLVAIQIKESPLQIKEISRQKNAFPELMPPDGLWYSYDRPDNTIIVGWKL